MYRIKTFNKISPIGLNRFDPELYDVSDAQTQEAMHLLARTEAIFVDPCYTGKSFHGFVDLAQNVFPKGSGAIYLHTGGIPAIWTKEHLDAAQPVLAAY